VALVMDENQSEGAQITVLSVVDDGGINLLAKTLAEGDRTHVLVLYDPGTIAVARALAANQKPSAGLTAWKEKASSLLSAFRANRHRMVFACAAAVEARPEQVQLHLSGSPELHATAKPLTAQSMALGVTAWQLLLAAQTVAGDAEAVLLDRELEVAAMPFPPLLSDPDEAFIEIEAAACSRSLLTRQLAHVRNELREQFLSAATAARAITLETQGKLESRAVAPTEVETGAHREEAPKIGMGATDVAEITNDLALKLAGELYGLILHRDADAIGFAHYYGSLLGREMLLSSAVQKMYLSEEFKGKFLNNQTYNQFIRNLVSTFFGRTESSLQEIAKYRRIFVRDGFESVLSLIMSDSRCSYIDRNLAIPAYIELK
jgi:hypothetical protein